MTERYIELHTASAFSFLEGGSQPEALWNVPSHWRCPRWRCWIAMASMGRRVSIPARSGMTSGRMSARRLHCPSLGSIGSRLRYGCRTSISRNPLVSRFCASRAKAIKISASSSRASRCARQTKQEGAANLDRPAAVCQGTRLSDGGRRRASGGGAHAWRRGSWSRSGRNLVRIFGPQNVYVELQRHGSESRSGGIRQRCALLRHFGSRCSRRTGFDTPPRTTGRSSTSSPAFAITRELDQAGRLLVGQQPTSSALGDKK